MLRPFWCAEVGAGVRVRVKNYQMQFLFVTVSVPPAVTPNHSPMNRFFMNSLAAYPVNGRDENDNARIDTSRFLGRVSVRPVVRHHPTCEQVS